VPYNFQIVIRSENCSIKKIIFQQTRGTKYLILLNLNRYLPMFLSRNPEKGETILFN